MDQMIPEDNPQDDTDKEIRRQTEQPIDIADDKDFTQDDVRQVIEGFIPKKAPGPDGITSEILKLIYKGIPKTVTSIYNKCLRTGCFPANWKIARILPTTKPGRDDTKDPSKYRPISLLNIEGNVPEKLLIKRIMYHLYNTEFLNDNRYGFTPQKNTTDTEMEARQCIEPQLERGRVVIMASLDVMGAFESAWWPAILKGLRGAKCPENFTTSHKNT